MDASFCFGDTFCSSAPFHSSMAVPASGMPDPDVVVQGVIHDHVDGQVAYYLAASPPDYRASYSGSGLPWSSMEQAFSQTPNRGVIQLAEGGRFSFKVYMPNSYYNNFEGIMVEPHVMVSYVSGGEDKVINIQLKQGVPYRTLTYQPQRKDTMFYSSGWSLSVRSQEQVLKDSGYPSDNRMPENHWGLKPPQ